MSHFHSQPEGAPEQRKAVAQALCCPKGCLRLDDCWALNFHLCEPRRQDQIESILDLSAPKASVEPADGAREALAYTSDAAALRSPAVDAPRSGVQTASEPVAWRIRHSSGPRRWEYRDEKPNGPSVHLFDVEPLYAALSLPEKADGSLLRCISMAMGCLDPHSTNPDEALAWHRLLDATEGREPRASVVSSAKPPCPNCNDTKRATYFSEQGWKHEERDCHVCSRTSADRGGK